MAGIPAAAAYAARVTKELVDVVTKMMAKLDAGMPLPLAALVQSKGSSDEEHDENKKQGRDNV